jgi:hypothetical protein
MELCLAQGDEAEVVEIGRGTETTETKTELCLLCNGAKNERRSWEQRWQEEI